jgi:protein-tyrosine phosphatase
MIDLHCHLLPAVDDGPDSWDVSIEMCRIAASDGIRHIVATPHANETYAYDRGQYEHMLQELQRRCEEPLRLSLGCDFRFSYDNVEDAIAHPQRYTIADSDYLLVELNDFSLTPAIREGMFRLLSHGIVPIVTHPERNPVLLDRPQQVLDLIEYGCLVQVTADSFTGYWGERPRRMAEWLLKRDAIHVVASDAHDTMQRRPILSRAYELVKTLATHDVAQALFVENPKTIVSSSCHAT